MEINIKINTPQSTGSGSSRILLTENSAMFTQSKENTTTNALVSQENVEDKIGMEQVGIEIFPNNPIASLDQLKNGIVDEEKNEESNTFLGNTESLAESSIKKSEQQAHCNAKQKFLITFSVLAAVTICLGLALYFYFRSNHVPVNDTLQYNTNSIGSAAMSFTEQPLIETTTIDPNTVEVKVNESFYSYNFL